jgi:1-acyl-sn-glycerol-3-phosphate acyltransferase
MVLQYVLNRRIRPLKFFLKQELIWVPVIGLAWWALGFPFMKRYSKAYLEKHPEKKGKTWKPPARPAQVRNNPVGFSTSSKARASPKANMRSSNRPSATCSSPRPAALPSCWMPWANS